MILSGENDFVFDRISVRISFIVNLLPLMFLNKVSPEMYKCTIKLIRIGKFELERKKSNLERNLISKYNGNKGEKKRKRIIEHRFA